MPQVFISYKHEDSAFVQDMAKRIEASGISTWTDNQIEAGDRWKDSIDNNIQASFAVIVVMTPKARESEFVTYEWSYAMGLGIKIIPVILTETKLHPKLEDLQHFDFTVRAAEPWDDLLGRLHRLNNNQNSKNPPATTEYHPYVTQCLQIAETSLKEPERRAAIDGLAQSEHPTAKIALEELINTGHLRDIRIYAAIRLADITNFTDEQALSGLFLAVRENSSYRDRAIDALRQYGNSANEGILELLGAKWSEARKTAVELVIRADIKEAADKLLEILREDDPHVYGVAATALSNFGDTRAVEPLIHLLENRDFTNTQVVIALGKYRDIRSIPALLNVLSKGNREAIHPAQQALAEIGNEAVPIIVETLEAQLNNSRLPFLYNLIELSKHLKDPIVAEAVLKHFDNPERYVRNLVADTLSNIGDKSTIQPLSEKLFNPDEDISVRLNCLRALGIIGGDTAVPHLINALRWENFEISDLAARFLGYLKIEESVPYLINLLQQDNTLMPAKSYVDALVQIGTVDAIAAVEEWKEKYEDK
jgi:HEAT repeat protein